MTHCESVLAAALFSGCALLAAGCGGSTGGGVPPAGLQTDEIEVSPAATSVAGGDTVTVRLAEDSDVSFMPGGVVARPEVRVDGAPAEARVVGPRTLEVTVPPCPGPNQRTEVTVRVTMAAGAVEVEVPFAYEAAPPVVASIDPPGGSRAGGSEHAIAGWGFVPGVRVSIGGRAAEVRRVTADRIELVAPTGPVGAADVVVVHPEGPRGTRVDGFAWTNTAPTAAGLAVETDEDTKVEVSLAGADRDGDALRFEVLAAPEHGALSGEAPDLTYTPDPDWSGADAFTHRAGDDLAWSAAATVEIAVAPVNDPPLAHAKSAGTDEDTAVAVTLTGSDPDGDALSFHVETAPSHGALSGKAPELTYTPAADWHGEDAFTYRVSDGELASEPATVSVSVTPVEDAPWAKDASAATDEDTALVGQAQGGDADGGAVTFSVASGPGHGELDLAADGSFTYTPDADWSGEDAFGFEVSDGDQTAEASVTVTVAPVNDAPAADAKAAETDEDVAVAVTLSGTDADDDDLSYEVVSGPSHGSLSGTAPELTYTPADDWHGEDAFTYRASDGELASEPATVSVSVAPVEDAPWAKDASAATDEDTALEAQAAGGDADGDAVEFSVASGPAHGELELAADGSFTYTPDADWSGEDAFGFEVSDGDQTAQATVTVTVAPVNDAPVAADGSYATVVDGALSDGVSASDVDGDDLTYAVSAAPSHGVVDLSADGSFTYTPEASYVGDDAFSFTASDGEATSEAATASITVHPRPRVDSITPGSGPTGGGTAITIAGADFAPDAAVAIDGQACADVVVVSASEVQCTTPAGVAGAADVTVTNSSTGAAGTAAGAFTYTAPAGPVVVHDAGPDQEDPAIAADASGRLHLAWSPRDGGALVYARSLDGGATWSTPVELDAAIGEVDTRTVDVAASGDLVLVTWSEDAAGAVYLRRSTDGGASWSSVATLSTAPGPDETSVAVDGSLAAVAFAADFGVGVRVSSDGGVSWTSSYAGMDGFFWAPSVAVSGSTIVMAYWNAATWPEQMAWVVSLDGGDSWSSPIGSTSAGDWLNDAPHVAAADGAFVIVWTGSNGLYARRSDDGALWSADQRVSSGSNLWSPAVALDGSSGLVACYDSSRGQAATTFTSTDGGASWSGPSALTSGSTVATDAALVGTAGVVVYRDWSLDPDRIVADPVEVGP